MVGPSVNSSTHGGDLETCCDSPNPLVSALKRFPCHSFSTSKCIGGWYDWYKRCTLSDGEWNDNKDVKGNRNRTNQCLACRVNSRHQTHALLVAYPENVGIRVVHLPRLLPLSEDVVQVHAVLFGVAVFVTFRLRLVVPLDCAFQSASVFDNNENTKKLSREIASFLRKSFFARRAGRAFLRWDEGMSVMFCRTTCVPDSDTPFGGRERSLPC